MQDAKGRGYPPFCQAAAAEYKNNLDISFFDPYN
jgi:hypothetical protein